VPCPTLIGYQTEAVRDNTHKLERIQDGIKDLVLAGSVEAGWNGVRRWPMTLRKSAQS
jgi:hypothetical protein